MKLRRPVNSDVGWLFLMEHIRAIATSLCLGMVALIGVACTRPDERMYPIGPDVTADLIVYFKTDATHDQIQGFWENVLSYPDPNGRGYYHRPGVGGLLRIEPIEGHEGIAINFFSNATDAQRRDVRQRIDASPVVFTVRENIAPDNVRTLKQH